MKAFLTGAIIYFFSAITAISQVSGGIKAGFNYSNVIISKNQNLQDGTSQNPLLSFQAGFFLNDSISKNFLWKAEMVFSRKGYISITDGTKTNVDLDYIVWPLLIGYRIGKKTGAEFGIEPVYLISPSDDFKTFEIGLNIGISYHIIPAVIANLRYNYGFPSQFKNQNLLDNIEPPKYQQSVLQLTLGYDLLQRIHRNKASD